VWRHSVCICVYVCVRVYVCVCVYVCMCVCVCACVNSVNHLSINPTHYECVYVHLRVCMCVCKCVCRLCVRGCACMYARLFKTKYTRPKKKSPFLSSWMCVTIWCLCKALLWVFHLYDLHVILQKCMAAQISGEIGKEKNLGEVCTKMHKKTRREIVRKTLRYNEISICTYANTHDFSTEYIQR